MLTRARVHPNAARKEVSGFRDSFWYLPVLPEPHDRWSPQNYIVSLAVMRMVYKHRSNTEVSSHACLLPPYHTDVSWLKNALKVDQSFFHVKVIEFESQV